MILEPGSQFGVVGKQWPKPFIFLFRPLFQPTDMFFSPLGSSTLGTTPLQQVVLHSALYP